MPPVELDLWVPLYESPDEMPVKVRLAFRRVGELVKFRIESPVYNRTASLPAQEIIDRLKLILSHLEAPYAA